MMKLRISVIVSAALALLVMASSCEEEETTREYLSGELNIKHEMYPYVKPGDRFSFTVSGVTVPDGTAVGYYFTAPVTGVRDTLKNVTDTYYMVVPDTTGTFSVSCTAYPVESSDKYYVTSASMSFVIVKDTPVGGSITGVTMHPDDKVEKLYGREYYVGQTGGREWIRQNLSYIRYDSAGNPEFGHPYASSPAMQNIFGAYYTWDEAVKACPAGWHLPSEAEWIAMLKDNGADPDLERMGTSSTGAGNLMVKTYFNGEVMWDYYREVSIMDTSISALPVGYAKCSGDSYEFHGYADYAAFWTSDEYEGMGVFRYIYKQNDCVYAGTADKQGFAASVRCVR